MKCPSGELPFPSFVADPFAVGRRNRVAHVFRDDCLSWIVGSGQSQMGAHFVEHVYWLWLWLWFCYLALLVLHSGLGFDWLALTLALVLTVDLWFWFWFCSWTYVFVASVDNMHMCII